MPLVSVMFNFDWTDREVRFEGLETTLTRNSPSYCRYDLSFDIAEAGGKMKVLCEYSAELLDRGTICRWLEDYERLLAGGIAGASRRLADLCRLASPRAASLTPQPPPRNAVPTPQVDQTAELAEDGQLNPTESALAEIWREVIGLDAVRPEDDFFDVGGHSLLATQIMSRVTRVFNVELPLRTIFESSTLHGLATAISEAQRTQQGEVAVIPRRAADVKERILQRLEGLSEAEMLELLRNPKL
jgi:hypothetical protein